MKPSSRAGGEPGTGAYVVKDPPHYPDILSLRQDCPSLASVSGGKSEMETSLESSLRGGVIAPRSRPGSPGGARQDARRLPATGLGWRRRIGPANGPR